MGLRTHLNGKFGDGKQRVVIMSILSVLCLPALINLFGTRVGKHDFTGSGNNLRLASRDGFLTYTEEETSEPADDVTEYPGPKVALMFLTQGPMHNEPVWRAFLEAAARIELKHPPPEITPVNLTKVVDGPLKPPLRSLPEEEYEGTKIQRSGGYYPSRKKKKSQNEGGSGDGGGSDKSKGPFCEEEAEAMDYEVERLMSGEGVGSEIVRNQSLFRVYTHTKPGYQYPPDSLYYGTQVSKPANTTNGFAQFVLVEAVVLLLKKALRDPTNQRFALLSESCIPIHSPDVAYLQIMSETLSRINACKGRWRRDVYRWDHRMETNDLNRKHWRKSSQWFVLTRAHAELIVKDHHVREQFKRYCYTNHNRVCIPDEHYIPTLLASYGLDWQSDCKGLSTSTSWERGWHPRTFKTEDIDGELLTTLQDISDPECNVDMTRRSTSLLFNGVGGGCIDREEEFSGDWKGKWGYDDQILDKGYKFLEYKCPMFARKFSPETVNATLRAVLSCEGAALGNWC
ncbi:hypothetical protein BSKO_03472 [Bryopsis sp. KO-2023]|nr:hypothetical protein BSKO_03472 [Bryopsis sp. KO-2023]